MLEDLESSLCEMLVAWPWVPALGMERVGSNAILEKIPQDLVMDWLHPGEWSREGAVPRLICRFQQFLPPFLV